MNKNLSACIVTYNHSLEEIGAIVEMFHQYYEKVHLIISDNSSRDTGLAQLADKYDFVDYTNAGGNIGFGAGHNRVLNRIESEYHIIVNPDVAFDSVALDSLVSYMDNNPDVGVCSPAAVYTSGEEQVASRLIPAFLDLLIRRMGILQRVFDRRLKLHELKSQTGEPFECYFMHGFFLFFRTKVFKKIDGFDESFFMYFEDLDILRRVAREEGYKSMFLPSVRIIHGYKRESTMSKKLLYHLIVSALRVIWKYGWIFDFERRKLNKKVLQQFS